MSKAAENFFSRILETIRSELRLSGLFHDRERNSLPMPHDLDAEGELCSAVIGGFADPRNFGIPASDFYSDLNAHVWVATEAVVSSGRDPSTRSVLAALEASGFRGPNLTAEVEQLRLCQPFVSELGLASRAKRVREMARRRELVSKLEELAIGLRLGASVDDTRLSLLEIVGA
jgi:hypothetical protein